MRRILGTLVVLGLGASGCGTGTGAVPTVTVTSTVLTTSVATSIVVSTSTVVTTVVEVSTSILSTPDPDVPGPVGGATCPADPSYYDETTDGLDPATVLAWQEAKTSAAAEGVVLCLHDGKRSRAQQDQTYADYVAQYGEAAAQSLVLPADKSAHVAGYAIDVQPAGADAWLEATDGLYGLCRMYDNEIWHFEYAASFRLGCPPRRAAPLR